MGVAVGNFYIDLLFKHGQCQVLIFLLVIMVIHVVEAS